MVDVPVQAVIFDLDGTLIDSKQVIAEAYHAAHAEVMGADAVPPPFSEYCRYLGRSFPEIMRQMGLPLEMHPVFMRESNARMHRIQVFDGIRELLGTLHERQVPMAIATGKDHARTEAILGCLGLLEYFGVIVGSDDVARPKPASDMALKIVDALGLNPATTLFVGDAVADLQCGHSAGMQTALALWDSPVDEVRRHPCNYRLGQPGQLLNLLEVWRHADVATA
ncbi:HAD-IA family hydrolase [Pseudomonas sp. CCOS 191]|uniref:HAD-IA family hydrolase n=1 Tax=Pseudomonas sp. CCOS 191 TaxID=1649877 RepID=UPI00062478A9|nr:HAD-IA family hydrolase [Pseudomonas sp. CCOS 191]CRI58570.1 hypothetical protein CCOS191_4034 [Pseudomonas sp. CCOS 191]